MTSGEQQDPNQLHPRPDFPQQDQAHPGWTGPMDPLPDHGEESYRGSGLLDGRKTVITGVIPGSAARWRWPSRARARTSC